MVVQVAKPARVRVTQLERPLAYVFANAVWREKTQPKPRKKKTK